MKLRGFIAYLFIAISIIMLIASVFPHHHHLLKICHTECTQKHPNNHHLSKNEDGEHHHHHCAKECEENACITQFNCTPQTSEEIIVLSITEQPFMQLCALFEVISSYKKNTKVSPFYIERLHSRLYTYTSGLRAPPTNY